ncbi:MAG: nitroreductase family protein [Gammaproteobacteria bacterium]
MTTSPDPAAIVFDYHQRTKHRLERYAAGPETLDWDDQPDPFRRFIGCTTYPLPIPGTVLPPLFGDLDKPASIAPQPLTLSSIGLLLELSFGLSAWKRYGPDRWALRCNPSSGNLHPTEAYLIDTGSKLLPSGVYHYVSHDHRLEQRCELSGSTNFSGIYLGLTSVHWREAWKYGERAYRYCQHDAGHALGALRYAAAVLGWRIELLAECSDSEIAGLLGIDRAGDFIDGERESPDLLCRILLADENGGAPDLSALSQILQASEWYGQAKPLSSLHRHRWPIIAEAAVAAYKPRSVERYCEHSRQTLPPTACAKLAVDIIRQRRSAQRFDGQTAISRAHFERMLYAVLPESRMPFDVWRWPPKVHLVLFVHRVEGFVPGLYILPRCADAIVPLQAAMRSEFDWQPLEDGGQQLPLYHLVSADCRRAVKTVSCHQAIASDSAFSVAMLAEFQQPLAAEPWLYRRLFWETGLIGQVLYLEAEAAQIRGTGIGCFFDDSVHDILGLQDKQYQSLYHFTVGKPLDDSRLQTLPAYGHLPNLSADESAV